MEYNEENNDKTERYKYLFITETRILDELILQKFDLLDRVRAVRVGDTNLGSFGVIGPTRMNYAKVLSVMNLVGASINELLSCFVSINDKEEG